MALTAACDLLGDEISRADPALLSGPDCAAVVELLARTEKRCAGMRALMASRAAHCGTHKGRGFSSPACWLADASGVTTGEAKTALDTAAGLDSCPDTKEALLAGVVSLVQAAEIVKTEAAAPGSESDLLDFAGRHGVTALKDEGRRRRQATDDRDDRYRRQRRERYWRHWQDEDGMIHVAGAFTPEVGVALSSRIDAEVDRLLRAAKRDGEGPAQPRERIAADAVAKLIMGAESRRSRSAEVVLVCDIGAFQRGYVEPGECCHVIGGGMVPVSVAQELATDAFIKAVLYRGKQIDTVAHFGRHLNAELRTALGLGHPPLFAGIRCADCGHRYGLQWDHLNPVANQGPTSYENLQPLCWSCHQDKTRRDGEAGLLGPHPTGRTRNPKSAAGREKS